MPAISLGATIGQSVSSLVNASSGSVALSKQGEINFAQTAQDDNKYPGNMGNIANAPGVVEDFWSQEAIDATRWNRKYPYQLLVLDVADTGSGKSYSSDGMWQYTLPIPPESLTIQTPFASSVQATLGGIVEEHNGAPFRTITIQANPGVLPNRETAASGTSVPDFQALAGGIFAGAIQTAVQVAQTTAQQLGISQYNLMNEDDLGIGLSGHTGRGTGYYQFRLLQAFLESFAALKKTPEGRNKRLAFANWKDQSVYVCTPQMFEVRRSASDPLAYPYTLQLKAWRRVQLDSQVTALDDYQGKKSDPQLLQQVLNVITEARSVLEGARAVIDAVQGDANKLLEPIRQTQLLLSDSLGVTITLAHMSQATVRAVSAEATVVLAGTSSVSSDSARQSQALTAAQKDVRTKQLSQLQKGLQGSASPTAKLFRNPTSDYKTMSKIGIKDLKLSPVLNKVIKDEIAKARKLQRVDFEQMRSTIQQFMVDYTDAVGRGSDTYNSLYGRTSKVVNKIATDTDHSIIFAMTAVVQEMSRLATSTPDESTANLALQAVAGLARKSGIAFQQPQSKFAVPLPYGVTLEQLSLRYLGDANRWPEIVALNGLRSPYIDEIGFETPMIANGRRNQVIIADSSNMFLGQPVTLKSNSTSPSIRKILQIEKVSSGMTLLTLDGDSDLARFTVSANAVVHTYLPDTANSQQQIYIPSATAVQNELTSRSIPGIDSFSDVIRRGGIDLLIGQDGDAAITSDGDWKLAIGLPNLIQRVRVAFETPRGSLPQHPGFGLGIRIGTSTSDLDAKSILQSARGVFAGDPDFTGIHAVKVSKSGPGLTINVSVGVTGSTELLPVTFTST